MVTNNLLKYALENGGKNYVIEIPRSLRRNYIPANPSCTVYNGKIVVNTRMLAYVKCILVQDYLTAWPNINQGYFYHPNGYNSRNIIGVLGEDGLTETRMLGERHSVFNSYFSGLEDVRLVVWNGKLYAYGTRLDVAKGRVTICLHELDENYQVVNEVILDSPTNSPMEKNWAAVEDRPFTFVYFTNPQTVVEVNPDDGSARILSENKEFETAPRNLRGNTNVVRIDNEHYIEMVHETKVADAVDGVQDISYNIAFVVYDNDLNITHSTKFINFGQTLCQFGCGLCIVNDNVYIAYSELDAQASILMIPKDKLLEFIYGDMVDELEPIDGEYYKKRIDKFLEDGRIDQAYPFINYCLDNGVYDGDEKYEKLILTLGFICQEIYRIPDGNYNTLERTLDKIMSEGFKVKECLYLKSIIYRARGDISQSKMYCQMADETEGVCSLGFLSLINPHYL